MMMVVHDLNIWQREAEKSIMQNTIIEILELRVNTTQHVWSGAQKCVMVSVNSWYMCTSPYFAHGFSDIKHLLCWWTLNFWEKFKNLKNYLKEIIISYKQT